MKNNLIGISGKMGSGKDTVGKILQYLSSFNKYSNSNIKALIEEDNATDIYPHFSNYQIKKFADKLKDIACLLIGCTREQLEDREFKEKELGEEWVAYKVFTQKYHYNEYKLFNNRESAESFAFQHYGSDIKGRVVTIKLTPRLLLQLLGTECGRNIIHPNIWVNALFADYKPVKDKLLEGEVRKVREEDLVYPNWIITDVRFTNEVEAIKERGGIVIRVERLTEEQKIASLKTRANRPNNAIKLALKNEHPSETALDDYDGFDYVIENNGSIEELVEKVKQLNLM